MPGANACGKSKWTCALRKRRRDCTLVVRSLSRCLAGGGIVAGTVAGTIAAPAGAQTLAYPAARRAPVVDDYHGTKVADPYRWLEDPDAPETRAWIEAENRLTDAYLRHPRARATPGAAHPAVELSQVRAAVPQGRPLLLPEERRSPEPGCALHPARARRRASGAARSQRARRGRHGRTHDARGLGGRSAARLRDIGERLGLGGAPRARRRDGAR